VLSDCHNNLRALSLPDVSVWRTCMFFLSVRLDPSKLELKYCQ